VAAIPMELKRRWHFDSLSTASASSAGDITRNSFTPYHLLRQCVLGGKSNSISNISVIASGKQSSKSSVCLVLFLVDFFLVLRWWYDTTKLKLPKAILSDTTPQDPSL